MRGRWNAYIGAMLFCMVGVAVVGRVVDRGAARSLAYREIYEGMSNDQDGGVSDPVGREDTKESGEGGPADKRSDERCPNLLIEDRGRIYLHNTRKGRVPGVNPVRFETLGDYREFLAWQRHNGIHCPVLYLQNAVGAQGSASHAPIERARLEVRVPHGDAGDICSDERYATLCRDFKSVTHPKKVIDPPAESMPMPNVQGRTFGESAVLAYDPHNQMIGAD